MASHISGENTGQLMVRPATLIGSSQANGSNPQEPSRDRQAAASALSNPTPKITEQTMPIYAKRNSGILCAFMSCCLSARYGIARRVSSY